MRFIKVGDDIINLDRVINIFGAYDGKGIGFWFGGLDESGDVRDTVIVNRDSPSHPALSSWLSAGMPMPVSDIGQACLDIDNWHRWATKSK